MKYVLATLLFLVTNAYAGLKTECVSGDQKFVVTASSPAEIQVTYKNETVDADGILTTEEVDLVAKFRSIGEMTLFAKLGSASSGNYVFIQGKRFSVNCR